MKVLIKNLSLAILIHLAFCLTAKAATMQLVCHKPIDAKNGANVLADIDFQISGKKKIVTSGIIFVEAKLPSGKNLVINSEVMSGQNTDSGQILVFAKDLRIDSFIANEKPDQFSQIFLKAGETITPLKTNCSPVPEIPKKK